ncbi:hypothetical protein [Yoonia sp. BS5-3]|uniref:Uncharacterized protein n=1 Tax=Yoonia phaeophyticola TaxID=3137369 RepID=A0ABZ2V857_9RHOB
MDLGNIVGKLAGAVGGGDFDFAAKLEELGVDASMLENLDIEAAKTFIEEKGFDLSMLDSLGLDLDDLIAKFTGKA